MAAGDYPIGLNGKFHYGTAGSTANTEANNVEDVNLNMTAQVATALLRGKTWQMNKPTYLEASLEFKVFDIEGNTFLAALKVAFIGKLRIALYPTDYEGGDGLDADFYITAFSRAEANPEFISYAVTAVLTDELRDPVWT